MIHDNFKVTICNRVIHTPRLHQFDGIFMDTILPIHIWCTNNNLGVTLDNGSASCMRQAHICTNDGLVYWRIYAPLSPFSYWRLSYTTFAIKVAMRNCIPQSYMEVSVHLNHKGNFGLDNKCQMEEATEMHLWYNASNGHTKRINIMLASSTGIIMPLDVCDTLKPGWSIDGKHDAKWPKYLWISDGWIILGLRTQDSGLRTLLFSTAEKKQKCTNDMGQQIFGYIQRNHCTKTLCNEIILC